MPVSGFLSAVGFRPSDLDLLTVLLMLNVRNLTLHQAITMAPLPDTMRAVVYRGANDLRLEILPVPRIRAGELLVRVSVCGVCPTDIKKIHYGTVPPPRVFGHETAGTIVRVGASVRGFCPGERVALHHHVPCLECHACKHRAFAQCPGYKRTGITAGFEPAGGGYAEYVRVMPFVLPGVVRIPKANTFLEGAMLEPVNTVLKAVKRLELMAGDTALVVGQGPIGLMFTRLLALNKVRVAASDLMSARLKLAGQFGARLLLEGDLSQHKEALARFSRGRGLDAVVVAVPVDAVIPVAQEVIRGAGKVLLFAHTRRGAQTAVDLASVCVDEKDLVGSYSSDVTLQDEVADYVFSRKLDVRKLVTTEFPLERTSEAVALAAHPTADSLKVMVRVQNPDSRRNEAGGF
jgi:L-iditol 2-dehydrogenase